ncbi:MAG: hypothetical protein JW787_08015 [Sedimentisphaerales bacterium]|nr:hypothetical protein [Sedimentisphaerales bacterium]
MKKNIKNIGNSAEGIVGRLAAEKKKTVLAACLVFLMAFMWIKVFTGKSPSQAGAVSKIEQMEKDFQQDTEVKVSYIDLPEISGRNDSITRDIFASNGWKAFVNNDKNVVLTREVNVAPGDSNEKVIRKIADNLKLEAFVMGENPRAYINDRILSVGDVLLVSDGADKYECEVVLIENNSVVMRCGNAEVMLKLKQVFENSK